MTDQEHKDIKNRVIEALEVIRPYLIEDGGDVEFVDLNKNMEVKVKLTGACYSCSMNMNTLKLGVEQTIMRLVPEVKRVYELK